LTIVDTFLYFLEISQCKKLFINLTLLIPLSLQGEGEEILERGFAPLLPILPLPLSREGG
jgi:hypothetical protein